MLCWFLLYIINQAYVCYIYPIPLEPPSYRITPSLWVIIEQEAELPVIHSRFPLVTCFTHGSLHVSVLLSRFPLLPTHVRKSIVYVCAFIPALQIGSSITFFLIPYMCVNL